jgi:hypothetical protein
MSSRVRNVIAYIIGELVFVVQAILVTVLFLAGYELLLRLTEWVFG